MAFRGIANKKQNKNFNKAKSQVGKAVGGLLGTPFDPQTQNNNSQSGINDKYLEQAKNILQPEYERQKEQVLGNLSHQQVNRGFYGQAPGDAIRQQTAADLSSQYQSNLAQQAQQIRQNAFNRQMQKKRFNWQKKNARRQREAEKDSNMWGTIGTIAGGFLGGPAGSAIGGAIANWF